MSFVEGAVRLINNEIDQVIKSERAQDRFVASMRITALALGCLATLTACTAFAADSSLSLLFAVAFGVLARDCWITGKNVENPDFTDVFSVVTAGLTESFRRNTTDSATCLRMYRQSAHQMTKGPVVLQAVSNMLYTAV